VDIPLAAPLIKSLKDLKIFKNERNNVMADRKAELKQRVEAKKKELEAKLAQVKADVHGAKNDEAERLEKKLKDVTDVLKSDWDKLTETGAARINEWLK